jgi:predicted nucleic acid-binding protein
VPIEAVVADANVLLSAVIGKAALKVFTEYDVAVHVAEFNAKEVEEYIPHMVAKYALPAELVETQWRILRLAVHPLQDYEQALPNSLEKLKDRDPDDAHALALATVMQVPVWTNDKDLEHLDVECYSTARLLRSLERQNLP